MVSDAISVLQFNSVFQKICLPYQIQLIKLTIVVNQVSMPVDERSIQAVGLCRRDSVRLTSSGEKDA